MIVAILLVQSQFLLPELNFLPFALQNIDTHSANNAVLILKLASHHSFLIELRLRHIIHVKVLNSQVIIRLHFRHFVI